MTTTTRKRNREEKQTAAKQRGRDDGGNDDGGGGDGGGGDVAATKSTSTSTTGRDGSCSSDRMGASEFAMALNGGDPLVVLQYLRRFVRIVRRERRAALKIGGDNGNEADDGGDDDDEVSIDTSSASSAIEEESDDEQPPRNGKRFRKGEDWKEDTAQYNVPFVGTSVSYAGDTGRVTAGKWPTGFLEAYLRKSPAAVELTSGYLVPPSWQQGQHEQQQQAGVAGRSIHKSLLRGGASGSNKKRGLETSRAIQEAWLKALSELLSAATPFHKLIGLRTTKDTGGVDRSLSADDLLQDEPEDGDNNANQVCDTGAPFTGLVAGILKMWLPSLLSVLNEETGRGKGLASVVGGCGSLACRILDVLVALSSTSATTARYIARSLEQQQKVSDGVLRVLVYPQQQHHQHSYTDGKTGANEHKRRPTGREKARMSAICLASVLVEQEDSVVLSCIGTSGAKDRKIRPGLLFLVLKDGISDVAAPAGRGMHSSFLRNISRLLVSIRLVLARNRIQNRYLTDIFSRDCIQNLCHIATCAPRLGDFPSVQFGDILKASDCYSARLTPFEQVVVDARRLIFPVLAQTERSPLLLSLREGNRRAGHCEEILGRGLSLLLENHNGVEIQRFVVHCASTTPSLLPSLMRLLSFPDPKKTFAFIHRLYTVGRILRYGPPPAECVSKCPTPMDAPLKDTFLATIFPTHLKKQHLSKALQSSNPFLVSETLKLLLLQFRQFLALCQDTNSLPNPTDSFFRKFPDLHIIASIFSRFETINGARDAVVIGNACDLLKCIAEAPFMILRDFHFDTTKLFPSDARAFCASPLIFQKKVLNCVRMVVDMEAVSL